MKVIRWAIVTGATLALLTTSAPAYALPTTTDAWARTFKALPIYGDGMISCQLDGARRAFVTGDATPRDGSPWAHSSMTVVDRAGAHVVRPNYPGVPSPYQVIPGEVDDWHWLGPCATSGGRLYAIAPHVRPTSAYPYFTSLGIDLAVFRYSPTTDPVFERFVKLPGEYHGVVWGAGVTVYNGSLMVFGRSAAPTDGWTGYDAYSARTPLSSVGAFTYWTGKSYTTAKASATPILRAAVDVGVDTSFSVAYEGGRWKITSKYGGRWGNGGDKVAEWQTYGWHTPWTSDVIATVPTDDPDTPGDQSAYIAWKHYGLKLANGRVPLTYNTEGNDATWTSVAP